MKKIHRPRWFRCRYIESWRPQKIDDIISINKVIIKRGTKITSSARWEHQNRQFMASCILLPFAQMDSSASKSCTWELAMSKTYNKIPEENKLFSQSERMRWAWKNIVFLCSSCQTQVKTTLPRNIEER